MNRRFLASFAAAAALVLTPAVAHAYVAPGVEFSVSDQTPAPGQTFQVVFEGATVGEAYTLTITSDPASIPSTDIEIAGTASLTRTATSDTVAFAVTLRSAGTYRLAVTDETGALVADSTVSVPAGAGAGAGVGTGTSGGALAVTGSEALTIGLGAAGVIVLGAGAVVLNNRRRKHADA